MYLCFIVNGNAECCKTVMCILQLTDFRSRYECRQPEFVWLVNSTGRKSTMDEKPPEGCDKRYRCWNRRLFSGCACRAMSTCLISRLSLELLARIFALMLPEPVEEDAVDLRKEGAIERMHPRNLLRVCRYWREVVMSTQLLWTHFIVMIPHNSINVGCLPHLLRQRLDRGHCLSVYTCWRIITSKESRKRCWRNFKGSLQGPSCDGSRSKCPGPKVPGFSGAGTRSLTDLFWTFFTDFLKNFGDPMFCVLAA